MCRAAHSVRELTSTGHYTVIVARRVRVCARINLAPGHQVEESVQCTEPIYRKRNAFDVEVIPTNARTA